MPAFGDYQLEIYLKGLAGLKPKLPVDFASLAKRAEQAMPAGVWSYVAGGCGDEHTQDLNIAAFRKWGLMPRMMVDAGNGNDTIHTSVGADYVNGGAGDDSINTFGGDDTVDPGPGNDGLNFARPDLAAAGLSRPKRRPRLALM